MTRKINVTAALTAQRIVATFFILLLPPSVYAEPEDQSGFNIIITDVRSLSLDSEIGYFAPDVPEVLSGQTREQSWDVTISSNVDWVLTIRGTEEYWDGPWQKPVSDILWEYDDGGFTPLDTEPAQVCSGGPADDQTYPIHFVVLLDLLRDIPGDYFYGYFVLELSAP